MSDDAKQGEAAQTREFGWAPHGGRKAAEGVEALEPDGKNHCFELVPATPGMRNYVYDSKTLCGLEVAVHPSKRDPLLSKCGACEAKHAELCPPPKAEAKPAEHPTEPAPEFADPAEHAEESPNHHE